MCRRRPCRRQDDSGARRGDLQQAIDRARPGDTLVTSTPRANLCRELRPARGGGNQLRTSRSERRRTAERFRAPASACCPRSQRRLAKLKSPNRSRRCRTAPGAHHWRIAAARVPADRGRRRRHHPARRRQRRAAGPLAGAARPAIDRCLHSRRSGGGPEARHRAQQRVHDHHDSYISDIKADRPGFAGDCRLERPRSVHDRRTTTSRRRARTSCSAEPIPRFRASCPRTSSSPTTISRSRALATEQDGR